MIKTRVYRDLRSLRSGLLLAFVGLLLGMAPRYAVASSSPAGSTLKEFAIHGQDAALLLPRKATSRLVLYVHGAGGTAQAILEEPVLELTTVLLKHGFAVAASDAHGKQNWGDQASVRDYVRLADHLKFQHLYILAQSMGGLDGVQLIAPLHPDAWAGIYPVCNAGAIYREGVMAPEIRQTYGGPPPQSLSPVVAKGAARLPILMWASPEDKLVPFDENAKQCARSMHRHGAQVRLVETQGEHGDPSNFRPIWLTSFFLRVAKKNARPKNERHDEAVGSLRLAVLALDMILRALGTRMS